MTNLELREQLAQSGLQHVSFSSMKDMMLNPYAWHKKYILRDYGFDPSSPASVIGSSCHLAMETMINGWIETDCAPDEDAKAKAYLVAIDHMLSEVKKNKVPDDIMDEMRDVFFSFGQGAEWEEGNDTKPEGIKYGVTFAPQTYASAIRHGVDHGYQALCEMAEQGMKPESAEGSFVLPVMNDMDQEYALPVKGKIDAVFIAPDGTKVVVDWKFKEKASNTDERNPEYDMQGATYCIALGVDMVFFVDILNKEAKPDLPKLKPELIALAEERGVAIGDKDTIKVIVEKLLDSGTVEIPSPIQTYVVDIADNPAIKKCWQALYEATTTMMAYYTINGITPFPNIFENNYNKGGGKSSYLDWIDTI